MHCRCFCDYISILFSFGKLVKSLKMKIYKNKKEINLALNNNPLNNNPEISQRISASWMSTPHINILFSESLKYPDGTLCKANGHNI